MSCFLGSQGPRRERRLCAAVCLTMLSAQLALAQPAKTIGQVVDSERARALVQDLAAEALLLQDSVGRKRLSVSDKVLTYDFEPTPQSMLVARPDRLTAALEILIRVNALRRDFPSVAAGEPFWIKPLNGLEALTASMIASAYKTGSDDEWSARERDYQAEAEKQFADIATMLVAYAEKSKLDILRARDLGARDPVAGYRVNIRVEPPKARVRYMPYLDYRRCLVFGIPVEGEWNDLNEGATSMIGRYHYVAEWPASLNGPEEGNFEVRGNTAITFRPKSN